MRKYFKFILFTTLFCLYSCSQGSGTDDVIRDRKISINSLKLDSVQLVIEDLSGAGFSGIYRDSLFFFDEYFSYLYPMDADGKVGNRLLGMGMGPSELPIRSPLGIAPNSQGSGRLAFLGGSNDFYLFDGTGVKRVGMLPEGELGSYTSSSAYTLWDETILRQSDNHLFYNVQGNSEETSLVEKADYPLNAFILMKVGLADGKMSPVGHYSETYRENWDKLKLLPKYYFDLDEEGNVYLTFQGDSLLYRMDSDLNMKQAFGFQGKDMDLNYKTAGSDMEEFMNAYQVNFMEKGYYNWVKKVGNYLFRSYQKSEGRFGLQIYENTTLIGDVETPSCIKVVGYVAPYFVSEIACDEETNSLKYYRFRLDE